ncbi:2'-5' RNA ligase family protein [Paludibacterium denitrificans]|uniref:2'-5' RNA ligase family protein n=1 Tax=Paludibacterium denitrificans TaxID=2675226 RepID=A0A844GAL6_9NEIS|nr:2'-5' RNA ligase family protein [Paludibacterium denitrificans]MTD32679.1 2'-5' RNA ligase family protein [Paludibacterium denitrificans]
MSSHPDTRQNFLASTHTLRNIRRDFCEWHLGRPRFAIWAIDVDVPAVRQHVAAAEQHLAGLLLDGYRRQPHITLGICGFLSHQPRREDDFVPATFGQHIEALQRARLPPFEIEIGQLCSFSSAPFFHISDPNGHITTLHNCPAPHSAQNPPYIPHVTVGLYAERWPSLAVSKKLDSFTCPEVSRCVVQRVSLMSYQSADIGGPLTTLADYHLGQASLDWHEAPLF